MGQSDRKGRTNKKNNHLVRCSPSDELMGELGFVSSFLDLGMKVSFLSKLKQSINGPLHVHRSGGETNP